MPNANIREDEIFMICGTFHQYNSMKIIKSFIITTREINNVDKEFENADDDRKEEMLDEARESVYDEYYDNWYQGLSDPYYFLVEEIGLYSPEDFAKADFVIVDYEKLGDALGHDYGFIYKDGDLYVFNVR